MTYEEKLSQLSAILPTNVIELLKAHTFARDARQYISDAYDKAYPEYAEEGHMHKLFVKDGTKGIEDIADHLWTRFTNELDEWLFSSDDCSDYIQAAFKR